MAATAIINCIGGGGGGGIGGEIPNYGSSTGTVYSGEVLNFPMTIAPLAPTAPTQAMRTGHVWIVMQEADARLIQSIIIDDYDRVGHMAGTLVLRVGGITDCNIYMNQRKDTGAGIFPAVYQKKTQMGQTWPTTSIHQSGMNIEMELNRPWGYARLITEKGSTQFPLYYFDGTAWLAPEAWDYGCFNMYRDTGAGGQDLRWSSTTLINDSLTRGGELKDFDLRTAMQTIRTASGNSFIEPKTKMVLLDSGLLLIGDCPTGNALEDASFGIWAFYVTKGGCEYIGKVPIAMDNCTVNFVVNNGVGVKTNDAYFVYVDYTTNELWLRRLKLDKVGKKVFFEDSNKINANFVDPTTWNVSCFAGQAMGLWIDNAKNGYLAVCNTKTSGVPKLVEPHGDQGGFTTWFMKFTLDSQTMRLALIPYGGYFGLGTGRWYPKIREIYSPGKNLLYVGYEGRYDTKSSNNNYVANWWWSALCGQFNDNNKVFSAAATESHPTTYKNWYTGQHFYRFSYAQHPTTHTVIFADDFLNNNAWTYNTRFWEYNEASKLWAVNNNVDYASKIMDAIPDYNRYYKWPFYKGAFIGARTDEYIIDGNKLAFVNPDNPNAFLALNEKGAANCPELLMIGNNRNFIIKQLLN